MKTLIPANVLKTYASLVLMLIILLSGSLVLAGDYEREKRWADEVLPGIVVGEPVYLQQENGHRFLSILAEGELDRPALIIVHGMGIHPDWGMVSNLRVGLNDLGYTTLSIQMPVLAKTASYTEYPAVFPEAAERLAIAAAYLQKQGYQRLVIVSHSNGSRMSRVYMQSNPALIIAWAALSITQGDLFSHIKAPILDLYAEQDLPHVIGAVAARKGSFLHPKSRQEVILQTDHFFTGREEAMVEAVGRFLAGF